MHLVEIIADYKYDNPSKAKIDLIIFNILVTDSKLIQTPKKTQKTDLSKKPKKEGCRLIRVVETKQLGCHLHLVSEMPVP